LLVYCQINVAFTPVEFLLHCLLFDSLFGQFC